MKIFRLSSPTERITGLIFSAIMIPCFGLLLYTLRSNLFMLILTGLFVLLISAALVHYVLSAMKAACIPDPEHKQMLVKGIRDRTLDLSQAVTLETVPVQTSHTTSRTLVFRDAEGNILYRVPTLFTTRQGIMAEPMAIELAKAQGLEFIANAQPWEYDDEKRIEHEKEVAQQQKEESKQRRAAKYQYRVNKRREKMNKK